MMTGSDVYYYFNNKFFELSDKYDFCYFDAEPCSIRTKEDLIGFVQKIEYYLFSEEDFSFVDENEENKVAFLFNGEKFSFEIDKKFGHIELNFSEKIKQFARLSNQYFTRMNPVGTMVVGDKEKLKFAWNEGCPINLDEFPYLHRNVNGRRCKKGEFKNSFTLNETIESDYYQEIVLKGLNLFFAEKKMDIHYQEEQMPLYRDRDQSISISLNYARTGNFKVIDGKTYFDSGFINQIFLLNHWSSDTGKKLTHTLVGETEKEITIPLKEYISTFGRD